MSDGGKLLHIGTTFRDVGEEIHIVHASWGEYLDWLVRVAKSDPRFKTVWAHNGGGWDWNSLIDYLLDHRDRFRLLRGTFGGNRNIFVAMVVDEDTTIKFCDSYLLFRCSLEKLAKTFGVPQKLKLKKLPHEIFRENPALYFEYLKRDCSALLNSLERGLSLVHERFAEIGAFGPTVGSTAMRVFTTAYLDRDVRIPAAAEDIRTFAVDRPPNPLTDLRRFLRDGYRGGRCEVFGYGVYEGVRVYDINSMYPWAMRNTRVPISDRGVWTTLWTEKSPAVYEIEFRQNRRDVPPVLMVKQTGTYEGRGTYYNPEISYLKQLDHRADIRIRRGFIFQDADYLLASYVDRLYQLRIDNPGDNPLNTLAKNLLNNLYGKFCQRSEKEELWTFSSHSDRTVEISRCQERERDLVERGFSAEFIRRVVPSYTPRGDPHNLTSIRTSFSPCPHEHVGIGGMITSVSRVKLHEGFCAARGKLLYCDTDSVHIAGEMDPALCGSGLGLYKVEFPVPGAVDYQGVYAGRKLYALRQRGERGEGEWQEKVRMKGVRVGGDLGYRADFETLRRIVASEIIPAEFQTTETMRSVWTMRTVPNRFGSRVRNIRRT